MICHCMASFWSRYHQPLPNCIFAGNGVAVGIAGLKISNHGGEGVVVRGIEVVDDRSGEGVLGIETIEEAAERLDLGPVADGVEAGVGA